MPRIGTAGWSIPRQHAEAFAMTGSHLERYARVLSCAEINSSFYRPHRDATWARWAASVPAHFRFAVKAPRAITHEAALACPPEDLIAFIEQARHLGEKLGPLLFQLPPGGAFDLTRANGFFSMLRDHFAGPVALEPRHKSWFNTDVAALLQNFRIAVAADPLVVPDAFTPAGWRGLTYYRLHGSPRRYYSAYTGEFLRSLNTTLQHASADSERWCIFDNTAAGAALGDALTLRRLLSEEE